ncbi:MAG: DUF499 domain-containing protein [Pirellulales bacterium]
MSTHTLKPWTDLVKLHPDVESDSLTEAMFAIDLGAIAVDDPNSPKFYRDAAAFFKATYLTTDLRQLLEEVLASLAGKSGYNRVLKLRTHFGGGKSHTLAALMHAARNRKALDSVPEAKGLADPGKVDVAVFDGEKFGAKEGKTLDDGRTIWTMWGWVAWQFGPEKYALIEENDRDRVSPGGDLIQKLLAGRPKLILLDEVLKYMERAAAVGVLDSTLQRQAMDFLQNLTVEVANSTNSAMVYSLQWSAREAMGNLALLQQIDKLTSRVDQMREPVTGDEILSVLQKRLLAATPPQATAEAIATAYNEVVVGMWRAHADTPSAKKEAEEKGLEHAERLKAAYPFHPALIDVMKDRWSSVDGFQRTRGALRFLASCLHSLRKAGGAKALLGPAEIPIFDPDVRRDLLKDLDPKQDYYPVISADIFGPTARAKKIDERLARENPAFAGAKPATRLATAILVYSFGGLRREGDPDSETLPPGVTESELLAACVGPDLDSITASAVLGELKNSCLYLHFDGVRYCFKKDPNVVKLIEDAEQEVARDQDQVQAAIKEMLTKRLAGHPDTIVWPEKSGDMPDKEPQFLVGYLPLEAAIKSAKERETLAKSMLANYGDTPRKFRNGIGLAIPDKKQIEPLRRAVRYLMAVEKVESKKIQHKLTKDQVQQLKERRQTEEAAAEGAMRNLYTEIWLPRVEDGELAIEPIEKKGRSLQATGVHEQSMELLTSLGRKWVHTSVTPQKLADRVRLGQELEPGQPPRPGVKVSEVVEAFYCFLEPPRLNSDKAVQKAVARGVAESVFGYASGATPTLGADGKYQVSRDKVAFGRTLSDDEVDLDSGFLIAPAAIPDWPQPSPPGGGTGTATTGTGETTTTTTEPQPGDTTGGPSPPSRTAKQEVRIKFAATRDQVFKAFPAIANLADKSDSGQVSIEVLGTNAAGFDPAWLRNAVDEPLDEADIQRQ